MHKIEDLISMGLDVNLTEKQMIYFTLNCQRRE